MAVLSSTVWKLKLEVCLANFEHAAFFLRLPMPPAVLGGHHGLQQPKGFCPMASVLQRTPPATPLPNEARHHCCKSSTCGIQQYQGVTPSMIGCCNAATRMLPSLESLP